MIGIICFWDRYATPYLKKYENLLNKNNIEYETIFWDRNGSSGIHRKSENAVVISHPCSVSFKKKIFDFLSWRRLIKKVLRENKYSHLIVLTTVPAVLLSGMLLHRYKNKFIFDIRDYTLEANNLFKRQVMKLINASALTAISSKGYYKWLDPSKKIIVNHNITVDDSDFSSAQNIRKKKCIHFAFVGNVRLDRQTEALLLQMGKREDFIQHYYGRVLPSCNIEEVRDKNHISNIVLHGQFNVEEKANIFKNIDLINAVYANSEKEEDMNLGDSTPIPNRLYDCLVFGCPVVASKGTYLAEIVEKYHLGCNVNGFDETAVAQIREYVDNFDYDIFDNGRSKLKKEVIDEENNFLITVEKLVNEWKKEE